MLIRNTRMEDIDSVMQIYSGARAFMSNTGNPHQWGSSHPAREIILDDIKTNRGYVVEENGEIVAAFFFDIGVDPTYLKIDGGEWINDNEYGVIHRIAVKYPGRGISRFIYDHCFSIINNIRIDTHKDNLPMQKSLAKNGFIRRGIIYIASGDERVAYQRTL